MKNKIALLICLLSFLVGYSQVNTIIQTIEQKDFSAAKEYILRAYTDTNNSDRLLCLYTYYIAPQNPERDSLLGYEYLIKYNKTAKKKINTDQLCRDLLQTVYKSKDIKQFNKYIALTTNYVQENQEAIRIRDQLAYAQLEASGDPNMYEQFIVDYPNSMQIQTVKLWLEDYYINRYADMGNMDSLQIIYNKADNETYKNKIYQQMDKLAFHNALTTDTPEGYDAYIKAFENGIYIGMAKENKLSTQYQRQVLNSNISDMIAYLNSNDNSATNYQEVVNRLTDKSLQYYSLLGIYTIFQINKDTSLVEKFAKRFTYNLVLKDIDALISYFPFLANRQFVIDNKQKAQTLQTLNNKKLTIADYTANKSLFSNLNSSATREIFAKLYSINELLPKSKKQKLYLGSDKYFMQKEFASKNELNFVLTSTNDNFILPKIDKQNIDFPVGEDCFVGKDNGYIIFSLSDTNGYGYYPQNSNKDIFISINKDNKFQKPFALPLSVNSLSNESHPVMSKNGKILFFSSDNGLTFGKNDIYICVREDTKDWDNWSQPILLTEEFNTKDNDYVINVLDDKIILAQNENPTNEDLIVLEGKIEPEIKEGKIILSSMENMSRVNINIVDRKTLNSINIIRPNSKGYYAYLSPKDDYLMYCNTKNYISFLDTKATLYYIEEIVSKGDLITIDNPCDNDGKLTNIGKKNLSLLAQSLDKSPYLLSIGVHAIESTNGLNDMELSEKQATQIVDYLTKNGIPKDSLVIKAYGKQDIVQGWESRPSIDIGLILK